MKDSGAEWANEKSSVERKMQRKFEDAQKRWTAERREIELAWLERFDEAKTEWEKVQMNVIWNHRNGVTELDFFYLMKNPF